jgi:hypothetical protein
MKYDAPAFLQSLFRPPTEATAPDPDVRVEDLDPDWRVEWEERAAVMEYDGSLPRERTEAAALVEIAKEMRAAGRNDTCIQSK